MKIHTTRRVNAQSLVYTACKACLEVKMMHVALICVCVQCGVGCLGKNMFESTCLGICVARFSEKVISNDELCKTS